MTLRIPLIPTFVVVAAAATMVWLGLWQLEKADLKAAALERYGQAQAMSSAVPWPETPSQYEHALYRYSQVDCAEVTAMDAVAGRSAEGQTGWSHVARCRLASGGEATVALGWSKDPRSPEWSSVPVSGFIGPTNDGVRLVATPAQAGLEQLAPPDPNEARPTPLGHISYAVQWFLFGLIALIIYGLALRRRGLR